MELSVTKIGSSRGIRLPKSILELMGNPQRFHVSINNKKIILEPESDSLHDWAEAADRLHGEGADCCVYDDSMDSDHPDWNW